MNTFLKLFCLVSFLSPALFAGNRITVGPETRPATLILPNDEDRPFPLVIFLHGYNSNSEESGQFFGFIPLQKQIGYGLLLPDGTLNSQGIRFWNATPECCDFENSNVDDAAYIIALVDEVLAKTKADPSRIFLFGHSNGGFMSYRLVCDFPDRFKGLTSIAGAFYRDPSLCSHSSSVNILQIHGDQDDVVPFGSNPRFPSASETISYWVDSNQCDKIIREDGVFDLTRGTEGDPQPKETDTSTWESCTGPSRIALWRLNGIGHVPYFNESWLATALDFIDQ